MLVGITPTGVVSFVPTMWTGTISDKEIVRNSGLLDLIEEEEAVVLPYMSYIGMCRTLGYGFRAVLVLNRVWFLPF